MRCYTKQRISKVPNWHPLTLLLILLIAFPYTVQAKGFRIQSAQTRQHEQVFLLDSQIDFAFSEEAQKALQSGIPIIILLDIRVEQQRSWWWNKTVAELQQGYLLLYHALTEKYIVNNLNSGAQTDYTSLTATLSTLGRIEGLPLIDTALLNKGNHYLVRLRARLDIESLPAPMRPLAYISSDWQLTSDWYTWPLQY